MLKSSQSFVSGEPVEVMINNKMKDNLSLMMKTNMETGIIWASQIYNFDLSEALERFSNDFIGIKLEKVSRGGIHGGIRKIHEVSKVGKGKEVKWSLPFNGEKIEGKCEALKYNGGLFTQCDKDIWSESSLNLCKRCNNMELKGIVQDRIDERLNSGLYDYKDKKNRSPIRYLKYLKKQNISKEEVLDYCNKKHILLNQEHWIVEDEVVNKRGRPKKSKKEVIVNDEEKEDIFAELVRGQQVVDKVEQVVEQVVEQEEEEQEVVKMINYNGKQYYKGKKSGIIYNMEQEEIGIWNKKTKSIIFNEVDDIDSELSEEEED